MFFAFVYSSEAKFRGESRFSFFYENLEPHGEWIELEYDNYVWRPYHVSRDWSPYTEGRWVWSNDGWYWDSYEPFGWATYHYGRWYHDWYYGWVWTPGEEWAPAWVEWRYDNDYIGWAPLPPYAYFNANLGIRFSISWHSPYTSWRFVRYNRFTDRYVWKHSVNHYRVKKIFNRTTYVTNYRSDGRRIVNRGIDRSLIEKRGNVKVQRTKMENVSRVSKRDLKSNSRDFVSVYRPNEVEVKRESQNKSYDFQKKSNSFLMREKTDGNKERVKNNRNNKNYISEVRKSKNATTERNKSLRVYGSDRKSEVKSKSISKESSRNTSSKNNSYKRSENTRTKVNKSVSRTKTTGTIKSSRASRDEIDRKRN